MFTIFIPKSLIRLFTQFQLKIIYLNIKTNGLKMPILIRKSIGNIASLCYLNLYLSIIIRLLFGPQKRYTLPINAKSKKMLKKRLYGFKKKKSKAKKARKLKNAAIFKEKKNI